MAASAPPLPPPSDPARKTFSLTQAAALFGVHRNTLAKWIEQGCPVVNRADRDRGLEWELELPAIIDWRIAKAVDDAVSAYQDDDGKITKEEADRRRAVANAVSAEIALDEELGSVISRHDAAADVSSFCQILRTGVANAAAKIASRATTMTSAPEIEDLCHAELNRAFEAAEADLTQRWSSERSGDADGSEDHSEP